jgi:hypothetical protein
MPSRDPLTLVVVVVDAHKGTGTRAVAHVHAAPLSSSSTFGRSALPTANWQTRGCESGGSALSLLQLASSSPQSALGHRVCQRGWQHSGRLATNFWRRCTPSKQRACGRTSPHALGRLYTSNFLEGGHLMTSYHGSYWPHTSQCYRRRVGEGGWWWCGVCTHNRCIHVRPKRTCC